MDYWQGLQIIFEPQDEHEEYFECESVHDEFHKESRIRSFSDDAIEHTEESSEETDDERTIITSSSESEEASSLQSKSVESLRSLSQETGSDFDLSSINFPESYPIPDDPGLTSAFWILYSHPPVYNPDGVDKFFDIVKLLNLTPIECLKEQLRSDAVDLRFYGIEPEVVQALSEALLYNESVKHLDLQSNLLTKSACHHLNKLLLKNTALMSLNLSYCKIGANGAMKLEEGISTSSSLQELNLSHCELGNEGVAYVAKAVAANALLRSLNISFNNLDEGSAIHLQKMFVSTYSLRFLDMSWNDFESKEAVEKLFNGLERNTSLTDVDMSWNSMGKETVLLVSNFISLSKIMKNLNLAANRFTDSGIIQFAAALTKNKSLEEIVLDRNPLTSKGITGFIKVLNSDEFLRSPLLTINFESFWATKDAIYTLDQLKELKPNLKIKLSGIIGNYQIIGPNLKELYFLTANHEAMKQKKKKLQRNFGHFVLSLEDSRISKEKFRELISEHKIKISDNLVNEIMKQFLVTKTSLDQAALKESYLSFFPNTKLPKPPEPKVRLSVEDDSKGKKGKKSSKKKKKGKEMKEGKTKKSKKKKK